jgi:hypothetical protein
MVEGMTLRSDSRIQDAISATATRWLRWPRSVESLGYDELFSFDHIGTVDPFIPLMVAAEATTRLRVGPLVLNNELHIRHCWRGPRRRWINSPVVAALGLGTGYTQSEHDAIGMLLASPRRADADRGGSGGRPAIAAGHRHGDYRRRASSTRDR